jgi:hypothetical protein
MAVNGGLWIAHGYRGEVLLLFRALCVMRLGACVIRRGYLVGSCALVLPSARAASFRDIHMSRGMASESHEYETRNNRAIIDLEWITEEHSSNSII